MPTIARVTFITVAVTVFVLAVIRVGIWALQAAKRSSTGARSAGWALLFLTSGRMPPPPPASQIEVDIAGKKDREGSREIGEDPP